VTFFDATTGRTCTGPSEPQTVAVDPSQYYCGSGASAMTGWDALSVTGADAAAYASFTITLRDQNDDIIPGFDGITVDAGARA
ncbi:hypothetical protein SB767_34350, partial [Bacillus sp. SIMBA_069]